MRSALRYVRPSAEERKDALSKMGRYSIWIVSCGCHLYVKYLLFYLIVFNQVDSVYG